MFEVLIKVLIAYLLGSLMGGLLVGKLRGTDIREQGSHNPGATNAWRTQGPIFGIAVFVIDIGKGVLAALLLPALPLPGITSDPQWVPWLPYLCGLAAFFGHVYPIYFSFRGGKGAATLAGIYACLLPVPALVGLGAWALTLLITGMVGLSTMLAAFGIAIATSTQYANLTAPAVVFAALAFVLVVYTHRENIRRMLAGSENQFTKVRISYWLLGRR
ncbi:MAG: glycerol-3-phosphate 1-O-acyltransferase PlsY [Salinisphaeraceae bacterium]|nr:glycerol-3-phosphate 1-O-acyltransferase PlsY [Salinisphaeraceae bacterium]